MTVLRFRNIGMLLGVMGIASVGASVRLHADLTQPPVVFNGAQATQGIVLQADTNTVFTCPASANAPGSFPLIQGTIAGNPRFWLYEYKGGGTEPPFDGRFYISPAELATNSANASRDTLRTFIRGKKYYAMTERDLRFKCNEGISDITVITCGNGLRASQEQCDDGNTTNDDGCSGSCTIEQGFYCDQTNGNNQPSQCARICGNGQRTPGEQCDDGNRINGDGCSFVCAVEPGFQCDQPNVMQPSVCSSPSCGNGTVEGPEQCDDGNANNNDSCNTQCQIVSAPVPVCGNGTVQGQELCDDGNTTPYDGCNQSCALEDGFRCIPNAAGRSVCQVLIPDFATAGGTTFTQCPAQSQCDKAVIGNACTPVYIDCVGGSTPVGACGNTACQGQCRRCAAASSGSAPGIQLRSVVLGCNTVTVDFNNPFDTSAHLMTMDRVLLHQQNIFGKQNGSVTFNKSEFTGIQTGMRVKLCHGNNSTICDEATVTGTDCATSSATVINTPPSMTVGALDPASNCYGIVKGYACDRERPGSHLPVNVYDGPRSDNKLINILNTNNLGNDAVETACADRRHGFQAGHLSLPTKLQSGQHQLYFYVLPTFEPPILIGTLSCNK